MILVIAGSYAQYLDYLRHFGLTRAETHYVRDEHDLLGWGDDVKIDMWGEWGRREYKLYDIAARKLAYFRGISSDSDEADQGGDR